MALGGGTGPPGVAAACGGEGVRKARRWRAGVPVLRGQQRGGEGDAHGHERRDAGPALPRLHIARDAALLRMDIALRYSLYCEIDVSIDLF